MIAWVPVLRRDHQIDLVLEAIGDRDHPIAFAHRERTAGKEIVLKVDEDEGSHRETPWTRGEQTESSTKPRARDAVLRGV